MSTNAKLLKILAYGTCPVTFARIFYLSHEEFVEEGALTMTLLMIKNQIGRIIPNSRYNIDIEAIAPVSKIMRRRDSSTLSEDATDKPQDE